MKFPDVLNDGCLPDYKAICNTASATGAEREMKKQKGIFPFGK